MGVWNLGLFSNDTSRDVRDTYWRYLRQQMDDEECFDRTYAEYSDLMETDEEHWFWFAVAYSQWKTGRLEAVVKEKALFFINQQRQETFCNEGGLSVNKWLSILDELDKMLSSPMPPRKSFRKPAKFSSNPWSVGDIFAYRFHTEEADKNGLLNKYIVFQKIGDVEYYDDVIFSAVQVFNCVFDHIPKLDEISLENILPLINPPGINGTPSSINEFVPSFEWYQRAIMIRSNKTDYPHKYLTHIGNLPIPIVNYNANDMSSMFWQRDGMEQWLAEYYMHWREFIH